MSLTVSQDERRRAQRTSELQEDALFGGVIGDETIPPVGTQADADAADAFAGTRARARQLAYAQARALQVQPAWVPFTAFQHAWVQAVAPELTAAYRVDVIGAVELDGAVSNGTPGTVVVLPEGLRPATNVRFIVYADGGAAQLFITAAGEVAVAAYLGGGNNALVQLAGVRFWPAGA